MKKSQTNQKKCLTVKKKESENVKSKINIVFLAAISIIVLGGTVKPFVKPIKENIYENRVAEKIPKFDYQTFLNKDFQNQFELALADQIPFGNQMKVAKKSLDLLAILQYSKYTDTTYKNLPKGMKMIGENLLYAPIENSKDLKEKLKNKIDNYIETISDIEDVEFFLYYIEKDTDINFETGEKLGAYEYIKSMLPTKITSSKFAIDNFDIFKEYFYKTDHHWNYNGSYNGYKEVIDLLNVKEPAIHIQDKKCLLAKFSGSKSRAIGAQYVLKDMFCIYEFDIPKQDLTCGTEKCIFGHGEKYVNNTLKEVTYGDYYGGDYGLLEIVTENEKKDNLLIIGESYDNAINLLVASHFHKTYNIDLRNYEYLMNKEFNIKQFIKDHNIDKVLFIGNIDFYILEKFNLKQEESICYLVA